MMRHPLLRAALATIALAVPACSGDGPTTGPGDGATPTTTADAREPAGEALNETAWPMHPIDSRFRGANGLGQGDVNGDGLDDFATNYEFDQRFEIALHPGPGEDPRGPWPTVSAYAPVLDDEGDGINAESVALGDLDGDGNVDLLGGQGWSDIEGIEGNEPGVRIVWGPGPERAADASAWEDGGLIPGTEEAGHFHWVQVHDVDGDGLVDPVLAGRVHGGNGRAAGIRWVQAPSEEADRRDLDAWEVNTIVDDEPGTHGAVFADLDEDGDDDIVLVNADFDTPDADEAVLWYENPGPGPAQSQPWTEREIYAGPEFDGKPQIAIADLDGDGLEDLLTQTADDVYWFRKTSIDPVAFDLVAIRKDPVARQFSRPIAVADLDDDGRLDIVGGLVHEESTLAPDKASVFWMSYDGDTPGADNWQTHVIKWGSGTTSRVPTLGEKWDQFRIVDVDGDGDEDVVTNNEEWWIDLFPRGFLQDPAEAVVGVVWFENRLDEPPSSFAEVDGSVVVEAEHRTDDSDGAFVIRNRDAGFEGEGYLQAVETIETVPSGRSASTGSTYEVEVQGGRYVLWARTLVPDRWGEELGGPASDSAWLGPASRPALVGDDGQGGPQWRWVRAGRPMRLDTGTQTITLGSREGGYAVDRFVLTTTDEVPQGRGPAETPT